MLEARDDQKSPADNPDDHETERRDRPRERELVRGQQRERLAEAARLLGVVEDLPGFRRRQRAHAALLPSRVRGSAYRCPTSARKLKVITSAVSISASTCASV